MAVAAERDVFVLPLEVGLAIRAHGEVGIVARMVTFRILQSMFLPIGIEVGSRGLEVRHIALRILMKMDGMDARRQILEVEFHPDSRGGFPKNCGADDLALCILELNQNLGRAGRCERNYEQCELE